MYLSRKTKHLSLPWFEIPNNETSFVGADMENTWTPNSYKEKQSSKVFPQRLRYPDIPPFCPR